MQSVAPNRVVSKFGKRKIGWVYHHCSGQQGRKRSGYFQVYSGPWVLLVASFPDLENLEASHQNVILIISSATSWKEKEMSWLYNPQNPLGSRRWVEMQKLEKCFCRWNAYCNLRLNFNYLLYSPWHSFVSYLYWFLNVTFCFMLMWSNPKFCYLSVLCFKLLTSFADPHSGWLLVDKFWHKQSNKVGPAGTEPLSWALCWTWSLLALLTPYLSTMMRKYSAAAATKIAKNYQKALLWPQLALGGMVAQ